MEDADAVGDVPGVKRLNKKRKMLEKVVNESFSIPYKRGGGFIKIEAWENEYGNIIRYSMAYINHLIFAGDNGRVIGYDNSHDYHHKHYFGEIFPVEDFINYEDIANRFAKEIRRFVK